MKNFLKQTNKGFTRTPKFGVAPKGGGFTLVETLVAIAIFSLSILGLMAVLASGISNTNYAKNKIAAGYLAQEGLEYVRNVRDNYVLYNPAGGQAGWNSFMAADINTIIPPAPSDTTFTRTFLKTPIGLDEVKISSTVSWTQGSGVKSVTFSEHLFNWVE